MPPALLSLDQQNLPPSLNPRFLEEEARRRIEQLAGKNWTDYNIHDPGITILELLAYAITDLGFRANLEIKDLIAKGEGNPFFTAREVLPSAPYTPSDYRRLLISRPKIRNAFFEKAPAGPKGLYEVLLDLEPEQEEYEEEPLELQEAWLRGAVEIGSRTYEFYVVFPYWKNLPAVWSSEFDLSQVSIQSVRRADDANKDTFDLFFAEPVFLFGEGDGTLRLEEMGILIRLPNGIPKTAINGNPNTQEVTEFEQVLVNLLNENPAFFQKYQKRVRLRAQRIADEKAFILQHRNLCEDWESIDTIRIQQIGLLIEELELQPGANPEEVVAQIFFEMDLFLHPQIQPQSFEALRASGQTADEIFDGPLLENGFISKEDLQRLERADKVYTSDLIRIIMQQPEVIGVKQLSLVHYIDRIKAAAGVANCLQLRDSRRYKPRFSFHDSAIKVFKRGVRIELDPAKIKTLWLNKKRALSPPLAAGQSGDLPIPQGDGQLDIATFYSIQNEFPQAYGLKEGEIAKSAPPLRKAQARQLKAYLLFFEQLLNNCCEQLANIQELFSIRRNVERTYFYQPLYSVPAVQALYVAFVEEQALSWEAFRQNCNAYVKGLEEATENRSAFLQRRHQFLDHLLGRFAQEFTDYSAWAFAQNGGTLSPALLFDKLDFLQNFLSLSSQRARAFDYTSTRPGNGQTAEPDTWNTNNVSGFEKRVAALLGMPDPNRRPLSSVPVLRDYVEVFDEQSAGAVTTARFRIWSGPVALMLPGIGPFSVLLESTQQVLAEELETVLAVIQEAGSQAQSFSIVSDQDTRQAACRYLLRLDALNEEGNPVVQSPDVFSNRAEAEERARQIMHLMQGRPAEGMQLLEHVLLRPSGDAAERLLPVLFESGEPFIQNVYSFQLSIFLPEWAPRFKNPEFQAVIERTLREELPAHIFPWIYWVRTLEEADPDTGFVPPAYAQFESALQNWLENLHTENRGPLQDQLARAYNMLIRSGQVRLSHRYKTFTLR